MEYIERALTRRLSEADDSRAVTLIEGAPQVGKTTLLRYLSGSRTYADLDDPAVRQLAQENPAAFLENYPPPVIIDEVQYAPELVPAIADRADADQTPDMFWIAGSFATDAVQQLGEELGERLESVHLQGLSQREKAGLPPARLSFAFEDLVERYNVLNGAWGPEDIPVHIWNGGLPAMQNHGGTAEDVRALFDPYIVSYILRDVSEMAGIRDLRRFSRFLHACAARNSRPVNYSQLAADSDISVPTAKSWLGILENLGIVYLMAPFESSVFARLARTPKMYFTDTGLAAYLCAWPSPEALMSEGSAGAFFENYVVMELISNLEADDEPYALSCFRDSNGNEIDIILERGREIIPLEIRFSTEPDPQETSRFRILDRKGIARSPGGIICLTPEPVYIDDIESLIPGFII